MRNRVLIDRLQLDLWALGQAVQRRDGAAAGGLLRVSISTAEGTPVTPGRTIPVFALWELSTAVRAARDGILADLGDAAPVPPGVVDLAALRSRRT